MVVTGRGRLGAPVAVALAQAGVGHVGRRPGRPGGTRSTWSAPGCSAADVGRPRAAAVADAIARARPRHRDRTRPAPGRADLVVQVGTDRPAALLAAGYAQRRQPHLLVDLRDGVPVVGPLVRPPVGPACNCLDLHRPTATRAGPRSPRSSPPATAEPACGTATLLARRRLRRRRGLTQLDGGDPETVGGAVEIGAAPVGSDVGPGPRTPLPCSGTVAVGDAGAGGSPAGHADGCGHQPGLAQHRSRESVTMAR